MPADFRITKILVLPFALLLALTVLGKLNRISQRIQTIDPHEVTYEPRMRIDARTYWESGNPAYGKSIFALYSEPHSGGMQVLVGVWRAVMPNDTAVLYFKYFNALLWLVAIGITALAAYWLTGTTLGGVWTATLLAFSNLFAAYPAIISVEPILTALTAAAILLVVRPTSVRRRAWLGLCLFGLCAFRVSYLIPAGCLIAWEFFLARNAKNYSRFGALVSVFGVCATVWNLAISQQTCPYFFHPIGNHTFKLYVNSRAQPAAYPVAKPQAPYGTKYIVSHPRAYLSLVAKKIPYFMGIIPDTWFVESNATAIVQSAFHVSLEQARLVTSLAETVVAFIGLVLGLWRSRHEFFKLSLFFCLGFLPFLFLLGASTRFIVPYLPFLVLWQVWAWQELGAGLGRMRMGRYVPQPV